MYVLKFGSNWNSSANTGVRYLNSNNETSTSGRGVGARISMLKKKKP